MANSPISIIHLAQLCLILMINGCDNKTENHNSRHDLKQPLHRVEVTLAEIKTVNLSQTVSGTLEPVTKIRLYNEESGRITKLPFHEGDKVKKGTLLIQLDHELLKTDVAKARANREQEQLDLERLKKLLPKKISTEEEVAQARTELNLAIAEEKHQLTRLKRTSIKAPIDGLITKRLYEPGDLLAPLSHIHTIIDPTSMHLKTNIAERWIPLIHKEQNVDIQIDALGEKTFNAKIDRIHPTINTDTSKGIIEILLTPVPTEAKAGQFARAAIALKSSNRLVIPVHAVHFDQEGTYVYRIIKNDKDELVAEKSIYEQGQQFDDLIEVLSGINHGDKIVTRGHLGLRDGKKVEIVKTVNAAE